MRARYASLLALGALATFGALTSCGARTELRVDPPAPRVPDCHVDADCDDHRWCTGQESCHEGYCVPGAPVVCMDGDACTADRCDETTRMCFFDPLSVDADMDGFRGPRAGFLPGAAGSCGDDCDDHNPLVHPGALEVCNGVDDNCNGVIDDNATFAPTMVDTPVSQSATAPSGPGGVAWTGQRYLSTFYGYTDSTAHVYFSALDRDGMQVIPQSQVTITPSDAFGAGVAWTGNLLGIVWQDRRDGDYEVYFNRLTPGGDRLGPDQRVSFAPGFSINSSIVYSGSEWVLVWQDERNHVGTGAYDLYAQRIEADSGRQIQDNIRLTNAVGNSESPSIAWAPTRGYGIAWLDGRAAPMNPIAGRAVYFASFSPTMDRIARDTQITIPGQNVVGPTIVWNRDRWIIAWYDGSLDGSGTTHEVWAAAVDFAGTVLSAPRAITNDPGFSRYPSLVALGDRILVTWSDDRAGNGYNLWARMLDSNLNPLTAETRITQVAGNSVDPIATLGPSGDIGILFRDQRESFWQVRFTRLQCAIPQP